ncbi:hypothetical protein BJ322DRAFT_1017891 [Thelephora terrestris]|uniref:Uncharacterized protein n=1 Tax=Thelephora terrestris TaxID=56493 RepID=A0A9P6L9A8_9AGAM|nr:hypothetical protein BJ322DRAFT_1017891 [Thelephora terrestris]
MHFAVRTDKGIDEGDGAFWLMHGVSYAISPAKDTNWERADCHYHEALRNPVPHHRFVRKPLRPQSRCMSAEDRSWFLERWFFIAAQATREGLVLDKALFPVSSLDLRLDARVQLPPMVPLLACSPTMNAGKDGHKLTGFYFGWPSQNLLEHNTRSPLYGREVTFHSHTPTTTPLLAIKVLPLPMNHLPHRVIKGGRQVDYDCDLSEIFRRDSLKRHGDPLDVWLPPSELHILSFATFEKSSGGIAIDMNSTERDKPESPQSREKDSRVWEQPDIRLAINSKFTQPMVIWEKWRPPGRASK